MDKIMIKNIKITAINFCLLVFIYQITVPSYFGILFLPYSFFYANYGSLLLSSNFLESILNSGSESLQQAFGLFLYIFNPFITLVIMYNYVKKYSEKKLYLPFIITILIGLGGIICLIVF